MKFPFVIPDKVYDVLKWVVIIVLPAVRMFYEDLADNWGWAYTEQIGKTIGSFTVFLAAIICISTVGYNRGKNNDSGETN